jgi:hypothetical protein
MMITILLSMHFQIQNPNHHRNHLQPISNNPSQNAVATTITACTLPNKTILHVEICDQSTPKTL